MIGSQLVKGLLDAGHIVIGVDRSGDETSGGNYYHYQADLADKERLKVIADSNKVDRFIHLVALAHTAGENDLSWNRYKHINVDCAKNVFDVAGERPVLFISTVDVYGFYDGKAPVNGNSPVHPVSNYGKSKVLAEGIPLYVNQGINAESVAEHALLLMLASLRRLNLIDRGTKAGVWNKQGQGVQTHELSGKTIGLIGMGNIAQTLVRLLDGFQVNIIYSNLFRMPTDFEEQHHMTFGTINEVFEKSDVISLHCALTEETANLINGQSISRMKDGVVIINTARGPMINADDLAAALISGKVAYAAIDVHDEEPIRNDYPLKQLDNVILTPHIAGVTYESFRKMIRDAMRNIELFDQGDLEAIQQYRYL